MERKMPIHILSYARKLPDGRWTGMIVGYYSSLEKLEKAKSRLLHRPGFRDYPEGFYVSCSMLDEECDDPMFFTKWNKP
jgi:hypothetical protein